MAKHSPILILGMHRSGTSCLTGCLQEAGLFLGNVNTQAGFNTKGNRENLDIMTLHDQILQRVGAAWDRPPNDDPKWTDAESRQLRLILDGYPSDRAWGTKDPRSLFMIGGWQSLSTPKFIGTFRHPVEVAASLVHRAKIWKQAMSQETAFDLWSKYNQRMLRLHRETPFDILRFDIEPNLYQKKLEIAGKRIGLDVPDELSFREPGLHNHRADIDVPSSLMEIWEVLNDLAL